LFIFEQVGIDLFNLSIPSRRKSEQERKRERKKERKKGRKKERKKERKKNVKGYYTLKHFYYVNTFNLSAANYVKLISNCFYFGMM
jgi:hypothetical protein